jgi:hypothetical protein
MLTPVKRHGFAVADIKNALADYSQTGKCEGLALHLPIDQQKMKVATLSWIDTQLQALAKARIDPNDYGQTIWISHITPDDLVQVKKRWPDIRWRVRVGTDLWLGARTSLTATAKVLDRHQLSAGEKIGYRQRVLGRGWLIIAAGGTAEGIGLEVPARGVRHTVGMVNLFHLPRRHICIIHFCISRRGLHLRWAKRSDWRSDSPPPRFTKLFSSR